MSHSAAPTPPLLLAKRLTSFLHANLSAQIHTALLTTLSGKLLAHASSYPVSTLRTQCTVASSLWGLYASPSTTSAIPNALPPHAAQSIHRTPRTSALTLQLSGAVIVLRQLRCGLLFVCLGPTPEGLAATAEHHGTGTSGRTLHVPSLDHHTLVAQAGEGVGNTGNGNNPTPTIGSPSEVESIASTGAATTASVATTAASVNTAGIVTMRRQAEELAKWLDSRLGTLGVPPEGAALEA